MTMHVFLSLNCFLALLMIGLAVPLNNDTKSKRSIYETIPSQVVTVLSHSLLKGPMVAPNIVTPTQCVCVPMGSCYNSAAPNDGTGQIDIRIVNNPRSTMSSFTCNYGLTPCCNGGGYQCGRNYPMPAGSRPAMAGEADFGEYPWQVALLSNSEIYIGSGALISSRHVLTAAHKVYNENIRTLKVRLGEWDAASYMEPIPAEDAMIARISIYPQFNKDNLQNDVAILTLATPVSLSAKPTIGTACLPIGGNAMFPAGQRCYVAGWGKDDFGPHGTYQGIQKEVDVSLISNSVCQSALRQTRLGARFILDNTSFICAGGEAGKDACTGDGGSPLVCQNNGQWYVVGLVAWGIGCANGGTPGVYVNVASYLPWIESVMRS